MIEYCDALATLGLPEAIERLERRARTRQLGQLLRARALVGLLMVGLESGELQQLVGDLSEGVSALAAAILDLDGQPKV